MLFKPRYPGGSGDAPHVLANGVMNDAAAPSLTFCEGPQGQLAPAPRTSSNSISVNSPYLYKSGIRVLLKVLFLIEFRLAPTTHGTDHHTIVTRGP
jgi:hypothetical protein